MDLPPSSRKGMPPTVNGTEAKLAVVHAGPQIYLARPPSLFDGARGDLLPVPGVGWPDGRQLSKE